MVARRRGRELKDSQEIIQELKRIEAEEKRIEAKEELIEQHESVLRTLEELGLMRWKSYYVLTTGAILLLSLTFVTSIWIIHDQLVLAQNSIDNIQGVVHQLDQKADIISQKIVAIEQILRALQALTAPELENVAA